MKIDLEKDFLKPLGLTNLPEAERDALLQDMYSSLESSVRQRLISQLTKPEIAELTALTDEAGKATWLKKRFPDYAQIVKEELGSLKERTLRVQKATLQAVKKARKSRKT